MRSMNSSLLISHISSEPGVVWIMALPTRPSAQPDTDILAGAAKAALGVTFEVRQHQQGIIAGQMSAHGHLGKPLAAVYRQHYDAVLVQNVHRAKVQR